MHYTYRDELVKCGKPGCKRCPHGPYLYKYWRENGKLKKKYCGLSRLAERPKVEVPLPKIDYEGDLLAGRTVPSWFAQEVLGTPGEASFTVMRRAYRAKVTTICPHHGNYQEREYKLLKAAWDQLRGDRR